LGEGPAARLFSLLVRMNEGGPAHARPRRALQAALGDLDPRDVAACALRCAQGSAPVTPPEWSEWIFDVPLQTVAELIGLDAGAATEAATRVRELVAGWAASAPRAQVERADRAATRLMETMLGCLDAAATGCMPASIAARLSAHAGRLGWTDREAMAANLAGLLTQTCDATAGAVGSAIVASLTGTAPASPPCSAFVEQAMRDDPPVHNTRRYAREDVEFMGEPLHRGDELLVVLAGAAASGPELSTFGGGRHACPGRQLAMQITLACLHSWLPHREAWLLQRVRWQYLERPNTRIPFFSDEACA
jgi:unspecific monooxygenase